MNRELEMNRQSSREKCFRPLRLAARIFPRAPPPPPGGMGEAKVLPPLGIFPKGPSDCHATNSTQETAFVPSQDTPLISTPTLPSLGSKERSPIPSNLRVDRPLSAHEGCFGSLPLGDPTACFLPDNSLVPAGQPCPCLLQGLGGGLLSVQGEVQFRAVEILFWKNL